MNCFLCNENMVSYLEQNTTKRTRRFVKCKKCGLVIDQTTHELGTSEWAEENIEFHASYQGNDENIVDLNWINRLETQSLLFAQPFCEGIFPIDINIVDYGCSDGKLSDFLLISLHNLLVLTKGKHYPK